MKNYYAVLDLPRTVTAEQLRIRYKQLVRIYHPDRFQNGTDKAYAEVRLKEITEAQSAIAEDIKQRLSIPPEWNIPAPEPHRAARQGATTMPVATARAILPFQIRRRAKQALVAGGIVLAGLVATPQLPFLPTSLNHLPSLAAITVEQPLLTTQTQSATVDNATSTDWVPLVSPSGRQMAFILRQADMEKLYIRDHHSGQMRQVSDDSAQSHSFVWSPDESKLAFVRGEGADSQLRVLDLQTGQVE